MKTRTHDAHTGGAAAGSGHHCAQHIVCAYKSRLAGHGQIHAAGSAVLLALAFLAVLFWRRLLQIDRRTLLSGLAMGGIYFCVMTAELTALKTVETSTVSFVTNTAVVIVPLVQAVLSRRWPEHRVLLGALACLLGVALLTLRNASRSRRALGTVFWRRFCIRRPFS